MRVRSLLWVKRLKDDLKRGYDLIRSQRDAILHIQRQKDECIALVVHDLKNPLTGNLANAQYLLGEDGHSDEARRALRDALEAAEAMRRMIGNLLDISRSEDGALVPALETVDVAELVETVRNEMARRAESRDQTIVVSTALEAPRIRADQDLVRRLLENLLDNCLKCSPRGATVWIDAETHDAGRIRLRVRDEGAGVPEESRERIFEKYVRLEHHAGVEPRTSRGLGLTFCRLAADVHGGRIWIEDNKPRGAAFCVELPVSGIPSK
jgi:K+-sensing histidine kinase KdpD